MLSFSNILFLMGLGFSLAAPLGPVNAEMIKQSLKSRYGFLLGMFTGIGAMTGDFIIATVVLFVGDEYLRNIIEIPVVYIILLSFNVLLLGYIGYSALRSPTPDTIEEVAEDDERFLESDLVQVEVTDQSERAFRPTSIGKQLATGFAIVVSSPWSYFWWTSFGGYILGRTDLPLGSNEGRLIITVFFLAGIFAWVFIFTTLLGISRQMASPKVLNYITKTTAVLILLFAVKIFYDGIIFLTG